MDLLEQSLPSSDPLSVLMLSIPDGGIGQYTYGLCSALQEDGVSVTLLLEDDPPYDLRDFPCRHTVRPVLRMRRSGSTPRKWRILLQNLLTMHREAGAARRRPASNAPLLSHWQWTLGPTTDRLIWQALQAGKGASRVPIVYTAHDVRPHEGMTADIAHSIWRYERADALIVHGENLKQDLLDMAPGVSPENVHVLPHGNFIPIADAPPLRLRWDRARARESFGFKEEDRVVLFFGYIRPYKGLDLLIEALRLLKSEQRAARGAPVRLLIAGHMLSGAWESSGYNELLQNAGLAADTRLATDYIPIEDIGRYFEAADIVAMPYRTGSQSGVLQMAYAYAKPAVLTNVGSIGEAVIPGETALVVPPNDTEAFAAALGLLIGDSETADRIGRAGRRHAEENFSWQTVARRTREIYRSVLR